MNKKTSSKDRPSGGIELGLGGILKGLGDLVEKLAEVAETGKELTRTGEIRGEGEQLKGIYGFTIKVGLGGEQPSIEPFGNIRKDVRSGRTVVQEIREPVADIFEEADHVLVVAEMPGISAEDVQVEVEDKVLTITAGKKDKKYRKEILLPQAFPREKMQISCNNGVLEVRCVR